MTVDSLFRALRWSTVVDGGLRWSTVVFFTLFLLLVVSFRSQVQADPGPHPWSSPLVSHHMLLLGCLKV